MEALGFGANVFLWTVIILVGFVTALSFTDKLKVDEERKSQEESH